MITKLKNTEMNEHIITHTRTKISEQLQDHNENIWNIRRDLDFNIDTPPYLHILPPHTYTACYVRVCVCVCVCVFTLAQVSRMSPNHYSNLSIDGVLGGDGKYMSTRGREMIEEDEEVKKCGIKVQRWSCESLLQRFQEPHWNLSQSSLSTSFKVVSSPKKYE